MWEFKSQVDDVGHFLVFLDQIFLKGAYFLMVCVFVVFVDLDHSRRSFHKIDSKLFEILEKGIVIFNSDGFSVFNEEDVSGDEDLDVGSDSFLVDFIEGD